MRPVLSAGKDGERRIDAGPKIGLGNHQGPICKTVRNHADSFNHSARRSSGGSDFPPPHLFIVKPWQESRRSPR
jgi:hypothetical protein